MEEIKIEVNKQMDGYTFSTSVSLREKIKSLFPDAHPANTIFVSYNIKSDFEFFVGKLESYLYPALLGIDSAADLKGKIKRISFIDSLSGNVMQAIEPDEKK